MVDGDNGLERYRRLGVEGGDIECGGNAVVGGGEGAGKHVATHIELRSVGGAE